MAYSLLEKQRLAAAMIANPTPAESVLYCALARSNIYFKKQQIFCGYIVDAYLPDTKTAIECDGGYHGTVEQQFYDIERDAALRKHGITVVRFLNESVLADPMAIVSALRKSRCIKKHKKFKSKRRPILNVAAWAKQNKDKLENMNTMPSSAFNKIPSLYKNSALRAVM